MVSVGPSLDSAMKDHYIPSVAKMIEIVFERV